MSDISLYTIGHSNRSFPEFAGLLGEHHVSHLVDIRRHPGSRAFPHFNRENLRANLARRNIDYTWLEELGGRRRTGRGEESPHVVLYSEGFRNYADYMRTEAFRRAIRRLHTIARRRTTAVMCAERFFWKCHRRLLSDHLVAQGWDVIHILGPEETRQHSLSDMARVTADGEVIYDVESPGGNAGG